MHAPFQSIFPCHAINTSTAMLVCTNRLMAGHAAITPQVDALGDEGSKGTGRSPQASLCQPYQEPFRKFSSATHGAQDIKDKKDRPLLGQQLKASFRNATGYERVPGPTTVTWHIRINRTGGVENLSHRTCLHSAPQPNEEIPTS